MWRRVVTFILPAPFLKFTRFCRSFTDERKTRFSIYHEIKRQLVAEGIPEHEIAFVHDYEGPAAQAELSRKLNSGEILYSDNKVSN